MMDQDRQSRIGERATATRIAAPVQGVLVVIVNYRTPRLVVDSLASLESEVARRPGTRVTVVDNASGDDSVALLRQVIDERGWSSWVTLMPSAVNGGFSYGNNLAVNAALGQRDALVPDVFWILNPDTRVEPGTLDAMLGFLDRHPQAGIVGCAIENEDGSSWPYAFRFPTVWSEIEAGARLGFLSRLLRNRSVLHPMTDEPSRVDWMPGASIIVRRAVYESIGMMDEDYFLYYEETDFFLRAQQAGWESWYVPQGRVVHIAGASTGVTDLKPMAKRMPAYWFESRRRYFVKHHGRGYAVASDIGWMLAYLSWSIRRVLQRKPTMDPPRLLSDFFRHSALWRGDLPINRAVRAEMSLSGTRNA